MKFVMKCWGCLETWEDLEELTCPFCDSEDTGEVCAFDDDDESDPRGPDSIPF
jgi:hypothetical protein